MALSFPDRLLETDNVDGVTVARLVATHFDESNADLIGNHLTEIAQQVGPHAFELDFNRVRYISSAGLAKVVSLHKRMGPAGGRLMLTNLDSHVYEIFAVTQLTRYLNIQRKGTDKDRLNAVPA